MEHQLIGSAIFGLVIGSFLSACIYRIPRKISLVGPSRSFCPKCNKQLSWYENIPLLSWTIQLGKCRGCKTGISGKYPLVELLSAIACFYTALRFGVTPTGVAIYALVASLIVITFIDLEFTIIPDVISLSGITLGFILGIVSQYTGMFSWPITKGAWDSLTGFFCGAGFFYAIGFIYWVFTKRVGLGGGDVKLMGMSGAILGWCSIGPSIFAGSLFGAVVGLAYVAISGGTRHSEIPFGPWLSLGIITYVFVNAPIFQFFRFWCP